MAPLPKLGSKSMEKGREGLSIGMLSPALPAKSCLAMCKGQCDMDAAHGSEPAWPP